MDPNEDAKAAKTNQEKTWWQTIKYGDGSYFIQLSCQRFDPDFLPGLKLATMALFETLTFIAWKRKDWIVKTAVPFLEQGLGHRGVKRRSIDNHLKILKRENLLYLWKPDKAFGNEYLVNPVLLREEARAEMAHYIDAFNLHQEWSRKICATKSESRKICATDTQNLRDNPESECPESRKICADLLDPRSLLEGDNAARQGVLTDTIKGEGQEEGVLPDNIQQMYKQNYPQRYVQAAKKTLQENAVSGNRGFGPDLNR